MWPFDNSQQQSFFGDTFGVPQAQQAMQQGAGYLDPQSMRFNAGLGGLATTLGALSDAFQVRPANQPRPSIGAAAATFGPAYNQAIGSQYQQAQMQQQAQSQNRWNDIVEGRIQIPGLDPRQLETLRVLGYPEGSRALATIITRPVAHDMTPAEVEAAHLTPGLPWQRDQNGLYSVTPHDPNVLRAGSAATTQGRVETEGFAAPGVAYIPPANFRGGAPAGPPPGQSGGIAPRPTVGAAPGAAPPLQADGDAGVIAAAGGQRWTAADFNGNQQQADRANQQLDAALGRTQGRVSAQPQGASQPRGTGPLPRNVQIPGIPGGSAIMAPSQGETQRDSREGHNDAERANALGTSALNAANQVPLLQRQIQLLDRGAQVGSGANIRSALAGMIRTFAGDNGPLRPLADAIMSPDARAFQSAAGELVLARAGGSLGPGVSNSDAIRFDQLVPQVYDDPAAARELAQILLRSATANARDSHEAYSASKNSYNARTDPVTSQLRILGRRQGVDFLTPDMPQQQGPPQAGAVAPAPPVTPGGAGAVAPPPPPPPPTTAAGRPGSSAANPARPANGAAASALPDGTFYIGQDGRVYQRRASGGAGR